MIEANVQRNEWVGTSAADVTYIVSEMLEKKYPELKDAYIVSLSFIGGRTLFMEVEFVEPSLNLTSLTDIKAYAKENNNKVNTTVKVYEVSKDILDELFKRYNIVFVHSPLASTDIKFESMSD